MILSLPKDQLRKYVEDQVSIFFPDGYRVKLSKRCFDETLEKVEHCFAAIHDRYFKRNGQTCFNHLNSDQYSMFLYLLSNTLYKNNEDRQHCDKIYYLNKSLNGIDAFYSVQLPDIFLFNHPIGTILGRAQYSDYLVAYQNCTVGSNHETDYPVLGKHVALYKGASILGKCIVGDNCKISANSLLMDRNLDSNKIFIGTPHDFIIKENKHNDKIWDKKDF